MSLKGFLGHHVGDLRAIGNVLGALLNAVPVNAQDRAHIEAGIGHVRDAAANITDALSNMASKGGDDTAGTSTGTAKGPTASQLEKAVSKALPAALAAYFEANPPSHVIAPGTPGPEASQAGDAAKGGDNTGTASDSQHDDGTGTGTDTIRA